MIALARFQVEGYVRSLRVLHPLIVIALIVCLVLLNGPSGPDARELGVASFGDVAAFMFPIWAWAARALLDTQPDEQRSLSTTAVGRTSTTLWAGILAAYGVNLCLGLVALLVPLFQAITVGSPAQAVLTGLALSPLAAAAGTLLGAWTSRAVIPAPGAALLALLGGAAGLVLIGLGRLSWLSIPMIEWLRVAHDGPDELVSGFPAIALHLAIWTAVVGAAYMATPRFRR
ncbi:hypothetical protein [Actinomadura litoris]|uniref:hypothetical protein n=1 Tax=Actinomadura litoris TaxID=2678616 RepID=UPI001FA8161B|nr:hypothetical protein [Actinomadura litoris]